MAVNDRIHDAIVSRQVDLIQAANGEAAELLSGELRDADDRLAARLLMVEGAATPRQLERLQERIVGILAAQERRARRRLTAYLDGVGDDELEFMAGLLGRVLRPLGIEVARPTSSAVSARARAKPIRGIAFSRLLQRLFRNDRERVLAQTRASLTDDVDGRALARAVVGSSSRRFLDGVRQVTRRSVETITQTITTHAATVARELLYEVNPDLIREERWVSTLDNRTSAICQSLDGRRFKVGEGITPPAHPNCRSARMPIVPKLRALPVDEERQRILPATVAERFDGQGPQVLTYPEWLRSRPARVQREILGPTRFALFQTGEIDLRGFVNDRGRRLTLRELRARHADLFDAADIDRVE